MSAEIRTLKDGETTVYPRTLASAVQNSDGTTIDTTIQKAVENTTQLTGNIDTVLENILTGESVASLNSELDNINGEVVGTDTTAKLDKIESTKAAISQAISDKGVDMSSVSVFGDYAGKIGEITTGPEIITVNYVEGMGDISSSSTYVQTEKGFQIVNPGTSFQMVKGGLLISHFDADPVYSHNIIITPQESAKFFIDSRDQTLSSFYINSDCSIKKILQGSGGSN